MAYEEVVALSTPEFAKGLAAGVVLGAIAMRQFMKSPVYDEGFSVYATPNFASLEAVLDVCKANGLEPQREISDEKTVRALMSDGRTLFNVTRADVWEEMGRPAGAPLLRVKDPASAAERAKDIFIDHGFDDAEVIEPMKDQTEGKMVFVKTDALACGLIGFRQHVVKMGKRPPRWNPLKRPSFSNSSRS